MLKPLFSDLIMMTIGHHYNESALFVQAKTEAGLCCRVGAQVPRQVAFLVEPGPLGGVERPTSGLKQRKRRLHSSSQSSPGKTNTSRAGAGYCETGFRRLPGEQRTWEQRSINSGEK